MDSNYHLFKKAVQSKGKTVHKWYYYWNDPLTGVMHQKVCKGCKTQAEAYLGRKVMTNLDSIVKSRDITLPAKVI